MKRRGGLWALGAAALVGCTSLLGIDKDYTSDGSGTTNPPPGDDGAIGQGDGSVPPIDPACLTSTPATSMDSVREDCGIFVAPTGADGNVGTRDAPVQTVNAGVLKAGALNKRLYVCNATYSETVSPQLPVEIYGGFDCANNVWTRAAGAVPEIAGPPGQPAFIVSRVGGAVHVEDFTLRGGAANDQRTSSIAAIVVDGPTLQLKHVNLVASDGKDGTMSSVDPADPLPAAKSGAAGGGPNACACNNGGTSIGAQGCQAEAGAPAYSPSSPPADNGASAANGPCGNGTKGSNAPKASDGDGGALGTVVGGNFVPAAGFPGVAGSPGQGGGGSCPQTSGGCGGCGGGGGAAGSGGGGSIGVLAHNATLDLVECKIQTGMGGVGGAGKLGADGGAGANGGASLTFCFGLPVSGGKGGFGGTGGAGGGGAGGISACVVKSGATVTVDQATTAACIHGQGGKGGTSPGRPGAVGAADAIVDLQ